MKPLDLSTNREAVARKLADDPEFRAEWERTALARAVALAVVEHRTVHELSQRDLARRMGMTQPQVARLERGDVNPSIETLVRLVSVLDVELNIDLRPVDRRPRLVNERARTDALVASFEAHGTTIAVATA